MTPQIMCYYFKCSDFRTFSIQRELMSQSTSTQLMKHWTIQLNRLMKPIAPGGNTQSHSNISMTPPEDPKMRSVWSYLHDHKWLLQSMFSIPLLIHRQRRASASKAHLSQTGPGPH